MDVGKTKKTSHDWVSTTYIHQEKNGDDWGMVPIYRFPRNFGPFGDQISGTSAPGISRSTQRTARSRVRLAGTLDGHCWVQHGATPPENIG